MPQRHVNGGITHELNRKDASKKISGQFCMKLLWLNTLMIYDVDVVSLGGEGKKNFFPNFIFSYHLGEKNIFKKDFV